MKKLKKKCENPDCGEPILDYKSSKKTYCNDGCRNRAGYLRRAIENYEFELIKKHTKQNYIALKQCINKNVLEIGLVTLDVLGFNINYLTNHKLYKFEEKIIQVYTIKDIQFYYDKEKNQ